MIKPGLYLNEQNGQTFEVFLIGHNKEYTEIMYPDFFESDLPVYSDLTVKGFKAIARKITLTFIGEV